MPLTAIFDIGKTNKKLLLYDEDLNVVEQHQTHLPETEDEDGFPAEDIEALSKWVKAQLQSLLDKHGSEIGHLNFSTYGATLVHLGAHGEPVTPVYNYLKPYPEELLEQFYDQYGDPATIARETASPQLGMLNSGMQLYRLRHRRPEQFVKIYNTLHFPQYFYYLFTGKPANEYTSLGCHTNLWHYGRQDYHSWVYDERLARLFPPLMPATSATPADFEGHELQVGIGIHDSSAALLPYLLSEKTPFILLSTGTWSIAMNPFNHKELNKEELEQDCLNYMQIDGRPVRASRLFLGKEYEGQAMALAERYGKQEDAHRALRFDPDLYRKASERNQRYFSWKHLPEYLPSPADGHPEDLSSFEMAHHQLMYELVEAQRHSLNLVKSEEKVEKIFVDGGFSQNELYLKILAAALPEQQVIAAEAASGSALGAALAVRGKDVPAGFLEKHYRLRRLV